MPHDDAILEQAVSWAVRVGDPAFEDWDAFTRWLGENPAHAEAYDRVCVAVANAAELARTEPAAANDEAPTPSRHSRRWVGGAIAASLVVVLAIGVWQLRDDRYTVETAPGQMRTVVISGGGKIEVAGGTRLVLDRGNPRFANLEDGQALFTVGHDAAHPFTVHVGDGTVVDAGTVFDVRHDARGLTVAVSQGEVLANPDGSDVSAQLKPGDMLAWNARTGKRTMSRVPVEQIGEWREGRLTFRQATLVEIAERLSRATGIAYSAAPHSGDSAYSGSVLTAPLRDEPQSLGPLLGVKVSPAGNGWVIEAQ
ncbi:MAG: FecR family protein [Croceibacterium sp.]